MIKNIIIYLLLILVGVFITFIFFNVKDNQQKEKIKQIQIQKKLIQKKIKEKKDFNKNLKEEINHNLSIKGEAFLVANLNNDNIIFSKNKNKKLGIASLTKIATASIALDTYPKETKLKIKPTFLTHTSSYNNLNIGEIFNMKDALELMMITSSNDIALAVSYNNKLNINNYNEFLKKMNNLADNLDMKSTIFFSPTGLDEKRNISGSYGSAEDIAKLVKYFYLKYPQFSKNITIAKKEICSDIFCHKIKNTNPLIATVPNILFSKTGWTDQKDGSLAMIYEIENQKYIIVVLGSTKKERFTDSEKLIEALTNYLIEKKN